MLLLCSRGISSSGSGDIFIEFSTSNPRAFSRKEITHLMMLPNISITYHFLATVQATEEAIVNALVAAEMMTSNNGNTVYAILHDMLKVAIIKYNRLAEKG